MTKKIYPEVILKRGREKSLLQGHPWIYSGAIAEYPADAEPGSVVCLLNSEKRPLALGFFNSSSTISFRVLSLDTEIRIDENFWRVLIKRARQLRHSVIPPDTNAYRLINAEGDGMPGVILDYYNGYCVLSVETAGMEREYDNLISAIVNEIRPKSIYERSVGPARKKEGLDDRTGTAWGRNPPEFVEIKESGYEFSVDIMKGQKTGFFLDQRDNRSLVNQLSSGLKILNGFSYTGAFTVYACGGNARKVTSVDASESACRMVDYHLEKNGFSPAQHPTIREDMFTFLRDTEETFDMIIIDPPAFSRSKGDVQQAAKGYKDINLHALKHLAPQGLFLTFSCSTFIDEELFTKIVLSAAKDVGRRVRLLKKLGPGADHPTLLVHREGRYLKGLLLNVL